MPMLIKPITNLHHSIRSIVYNNIRPIFIKIRSSGISGRPIHALSSALCQLNIA